MTVHLSVCLWVFFSVAVFVCLCLCVLVLISALVVSRVRVVVHPEPRRISNNQQNSEPFKITQRWIERLQILITKQLSHISKCPQY